MPFRRLFWVGDHFRGGKALLVGDELGGVGEVLEPLVQTEGRAHERAAGEGGRLVAGGAETVRDGLGLVDEVDDAILQNWEGYQLAAKEQEKSPRSYEFAMMFADALEQAAPKGEGGEDETESAGEGDSDA